MIIILPLSHERMEAQRLPYITIGIVIFNVFIFLVTHYTVVPRSYEKRIEREYELVEYYFGHPYLEIPEETFNKLLPYNQEQIEYMKELGLEEAFGEAFDQSAITEHVLGTLGSGEEMESEEEALAEIRRQEQEVFDKLVTNFEKAYNNQFYAKYGYIPSEGGIFPMFSSMFLHGGILHLLGNMLFLWLSGCNIEDLWGRIIFPVFYLISGVVAAVAHGMMFPNSPVPLIGASGAIAAVMGAFLIRLYDTKIYFVYLIWLGLRPRRGRFMAPAYVMLPLWLLQQLWEGFMFSEGSGVAFWAHIGGFVFGAAVALLIKVSGLEEKYIAPALDKKTAVLDEHVASGMAKLQEDDVDGAILDLKTASRENPNDPIVHSELSRAYFKKGNKNLASREFKRAVHIYMKQNRMDDAVDEYLDTISELPEMMLDPPQQMKIAAAIEKRAANARTMYSNEKEAAEMEQQLFSQAALAYRSLISHYQRVKKTLDHPQAAKALTHYGDICLQYLDHPKDAYKAYKAALQSSQLSPDRKQELQAKAQQAMQVAAEQAKKAEEAKKKELLRQQQRKEVAKQIAQAGQWDRDREISTPSAPTIQKSKPDIPIQKRIKLVPETDAPAKYQVGSVAPIVANKVVPVPGGMDLHRPADKPILFRDIYVICVAQVPEIIQRVKQVKKKQKVNYVKYEEKREIIAADVFLGGRGRPYRIATDRIAYAQFFPKPLQSSLDNFRQFILLMISHVDSVYLDRGTVNFLKIGKARAFSRQDDLQLHEKIFWKQLMGAVRFQCENCWEVYWIDGNRVPEAGAKTKCAKCGNPIFVQRVKYEA